MSVRLGSGGLLSQGRGIKIEEQVVEKQDQKTTKKAEESIKATTKTIKATDLVELIKPERIKLLNYIRKNKEVLLTGLIKFSGRSRMSINNDIKVLLKHKLIKVDEVKNPAHGVRKVISATASEKITVQTQI